MTLSPSARFFLLLLLAFGLRLYGIGHPLTDMQYWRQTDTAAMARNFTTEEMNILHPRIDWRGDTPGYVESEFPLYPFMVACLYKAWGGPEAMLGRWVSVLFALLTVALIYRLASALYDPLTAWISAFVYAAAPLSLYYTRTFMPESMMMFFFMAALLAFYRWTEQPSWRAWSLALLCASLAILLKLTAMLVFFPMLGLLYDRRRFAFLRDPRVLLFFPAAMIAPALWYYHAYTLFQDTGLTFGILGAGYNKFQTFFMWGQIGWVVGVLGSRFFEMLLSPVGGTLFLFGLGMSFLKPGAFPRRGFLYAWLAGFLVYVMVVVEGNCVQEYYQIFLIPLAGLVIARGLLTLTDALLVSQPRQRRFFLVAACVLFLGASCLSVARSYAPMPYVNRALRFSRAASGYSKPGDLFLVVDNNLKYDPKWYFQQRNRISPPQILYFLDRRGWVLLPHEMKHFGPQQMAYFMDMGAKYFVVPLPVLQSLPDLQAWLRDKQTTLMIDTQDDLALFRLTPEAAGKP